MDNTFPFQLMLTSHLSPDENTGMVMPNTVTVVELFQNSGFTAFIGTLAGGLISFFATIWTTRANIKLEEKKSIKKKFLQVLTENLKFLKSYSFMRENFLDQLDLIRKATKISLTSRLFKESLINMQSKWINTLFSFHQKSLTY